MYKVAEFFAGTGGFSHGLKNVGCFETIFANDINKHCKTIFDANNSTKMILKDIHEINIDTIPTMDIMTFGFPCQPFSIAGKLKGFEDKRSNVFWKMCEIIDYHKPKVIFIENVKNLTSHNEGNTFKVINKKLVELGYFIKYKILNTSVVTGIPQNRERIFIIGFRNKEHFDKFEFPKETVTLKKIEEFLSEPDEINEKYYYTDRYKIWDTVKEGVKEKGKVYQLRRTFVRENKNNVCPTLTANMGGGGHNVPFILDDKGIRKLTPRECFRFQGFPEEYKLPESLSDSVLYKLAGNAVTVKMIECIGKQIQESLF
jgi:DNA (cytosine-5)-methyltransferase 1